jgi:hypothetical protein
MKIAFYKATRPGLMGNVGFVIGFIRDSEGKFSCAESIAAALGYTAPWRYSPAILHSLTMGARS